VALKQIAKSRTVPEPDRKSSAQAAGMKKTDVEHTRTASDCTGCSLHYPLDTDLLDFGDLDRALEWA
jgi:hypothetical protein